MSTLYALVFTDKEGKKVFVDVDNAPIFYFDYGEIVNTVRNLRIEIKWRVDNRPTTTTSLFFGTKTTYDPLPQEYRELLKQILDTMSIERVYDVVLGTNPSNTFSVLKQE